MGAFRQKDTIQADMTCFDQWDIWWARVIAKREMVEKCVTPRILFECVCRHTDMNRTECKLPDFNIGFILCDDVSWSVAVNSDLPSLPAVILNHIRNGPLIGELTPSQWLKCNCLYPSSLSCSRMQEQRKRMCPSEIIGPETSADSESHFHALLPSFQCEQEQKSEKGVSKQRGGF